MRKSGSETFWGEWGVWSKMAGINDRVQNFLKSWPKVKEQLNKLLEGEDGNRLLNRQESGNVDEDQSIQNINQLATSKEIKG